MTFRSRDLLALAHQLSCQVRVDGVCEGGEGEPAHSNQQRHGKGMAIKASDVFFASACRACHHELDHGSKLTREQRLDYWQRGFERTLEALWSGGFLRVAG